MRLHLKVDTGMSRGGATVEELPALAAALRRAEDEGTVDVVGLWSHLSRADEPASRTTEEHLERFRQAEQAVRAAGLTPPIHLLTTSPPPEDSCGTRRPAWTWCAQASACTG